MYHKKPFFIVVLMLVIFVAIPINADNGANIPSLIRQAQPSVVMINTYNSDSTELAFGTGFFVNQNGDVVTNAHVLYGAFRAEIKTVDGKVYSINKILALDSTWDLVKVSITDPPKKVRPLKVISVIPQVGEKVIAVGNPYRLEMTVSEGIISAVRKILGTGNIIQITAPISPGSSGSPIINRKGEVIGIASFMFKEGQNLNFAVPGEQIIKLINTVFVENQSIVQWHEKTTKNEFSKEETSQIAGTIHEAAMKGDLAKVKMIVEHGISVNVKDKGGWTSLHWAAREGREEIVKYLVNNGAAINLEDNQGYKPIELAAKAGFTPIVKYLLSKTLDSIASKDSCQIRSYGYTLKRLGDIYDKNGDYNTGYDYWTKSFELLKKCDNYDNTGNIIRNLSLFVQYANTLLSKIAG